MKRIAVMGIRHGWKFADILSHRSEEVGGVLAALNSRTILDHTPPNVPEPAIAAAVPLFNDFYRMLDELDGKLDGVIAAVPTYMHKEVILAAAQRGIPLLMEKPMVHSVAEGVEVEDILRRYNFEKKLTIGHHRRFSPIINTVREIIQGGEIGRVLGANLLYATRKDNGYFQPPRDWHIRPGAGGPILTNASHDIDALQYIMGEEIVSVQAYSDNQARGNSVEDTAACIFRLTGGAIVSYFITDGSPADMYYDGCAKEDPYFHPCDNDCYFFFGDRGSLSVPSMTIKFHDGTIESGWIAPLKSKQYPVRREDPITGEIRHFCRMVGGEVGPKVSASDAIATLQVLDAIKLSAEVGRQVTINYKKNLERMLFI